MVGDHTHACSEPLNCLLSVNEHLMMCVQLFAYQYQFHSCLCSQVQYVQTLTQTHTDPITSVGAKMNEHRDSDNLLFYLLTL